MLTQTDSGSGGSRIEVKTRFDDGDEDDYLHQIAELRTKVNAVRHVGEIAARSSAWSAVDWLGWQALGPNLNLPSLREAAVLQRPLPESIEIFSQYN